MKLRPLSLNTLSPPRDQKIYMAIYETTSHRIDIALYLPLIAYQIYIERAFVYW
jgi:hypothetical protein